jgi:hypothetical protein
MKPTLEIKVNNSIVNNIEDVIKLALNEEDKMLVFEQLLKLFNCFDTLPDLEAYSIEKLKSENEYIKRKLQSTIFNNAIDKITIEFLSKNTESAIADLIINPNPVNIHCTYKNKGYDFPIALMNIVAIDSDARGKNIFLRRGITKDGISFPKVSTNDSSLTFKNLLHKLQKNGIHLMLANRSTAINIFHYNLEIDGHFVLNIPTPKDFNKDLILVKTDIKFNKEIYYKRLFEIEYLNKSHQDLRVNQEKIDEITRYKNSLLIT